VIRIRGQIAMGDLDGARRAAESWSGDLDPTRLPAEMIAPLADALDQLGLYHQAADAHRAVIAASTPGAARWLEARYGLAVAYYRTDRPTEARRLIDGTMALHPDLGGNDDLRERFLRLRRRLQSP
jgi:tetratricopeptide (TPR) repeat protein